MKTINITTVLEKSNRENLANVLSSLAADTLLYIMGVVDMPCIGQKVIVDEYGTTGIVKDIDYTDGRVKVEYDRPWIRFYNEQGTNWSCCEDEKRGYTVKTEGVDENYTEWFYLKSLTL